MSYTSGRYYGNRRPYQVPDNNVNSQMMGPPNNTSSGTPGSTTPGTTNATPGLPRRNGQTPPANRTTPSTGMTPERTPATPGTGTPGTGAGTPGTGTTPARSNGMGTRIGSGTIPATPSTPGSDMGTTPSRPGNSMGTGTGNSTAPATPSTPGSDLGTMPSLPGNGMGTGMIPTTPSTPSSDMGTVPFRSGAGMDTTNSTGSRMGNGTTPNIPATPGFDMGTAPSRPGTGIGTGVTPTTPPTPGIGTGVTPSRPGTGMGANPYRSGTGNGNGIGTGVTPTTPPTPGIGTGATPSRPAPGMGTGAITTPANPPAAPGTSAAPGQEMNRMPYLYGTAPDMPTPSSDNGYVIYTPPYTLAPGMPPNNIPYPETSSYVAPGMPGWQDNTIAPPPDVRTYQDFATYQIFSNSYLPNNPYGVPMGVPLYPLYGYDNSADLDKDLDYMKELYPNTAKVILKEISKECDSMDYDGSCIYDEYPDRVTLEKIVDRIYDKVKDMEQEEPKVEANSLYFYPPRRRRDNLRDLVTLVLLSEMFNRRRRYRSRKRWY